MAKPIPRLSPEQVKAVVATAWTDTPPYNRVMHQHGVGPGELAQLMKRELTSSAYKEWTSRGKAAKRPTVKAVFPYGR